MWIYNYPNELYHHGILGMKWGVRKDGSGGFGRRKASSMSDDELTTSTKRMKLEDTYSKTTTNRSKAKLESYQKMANNASQMSNSLNQINNKKKSKRTVAAMDLSSMSDKELRDAINRKMLENQYTNMFSPDETSRGQRLVDNILDYGGPALAATSSALGIALAIKELKAP